MWLLLGQMPVDTQDFLQWGALGVLTLVLIGLGVGSIFVIRQTMRWIERRDKLCEDRVNQLSEFQQSELVKLVKESQRTNLRCARAMRRSAESTKESASAMRESAAAMERCYVALERQGRDIIRKTPDEPTPEGA